MKTSTPAPEVGRPLRVHFSCGACSAVSLIIAAKSGQPVDAVYANPGAEHPDNQRFRLEIEAYTGVPITVVKSEKYDNPMEVWTGERFIKGPNGASCSRALKRVPLSPFWEAGMDHIFGFAAHEVDRLESIAAHEKPLVVRSFLVERGITKEDCWQVLHALGIELPIMYRLGFNNANCIGCPKGGRGYWNRIRIVFPEVFAETARIQREIGRSAAFWPATSEGGERIMLDELPLSAGVHDDPDIACDMFCADIAQRLGFEVA